MNFHKKSKQASLFQQIPILPLKIQWANIQILQYENLCNGVNGVGIPDLLIFDQAKKTKVHLWTFDKHFRLMNAKNEIILFTTDDNTAE